MRDPPEEARLVDEERIVDAQLLPRRLELVLGRVLVADEEAGLIGRIWKKITSRKS
jgi:hypothetical protein